MPDFLVLPFPLDLKQTASNGKVYYRLSTNFTLLQKAKDIINSYPGTNGFVPDVLIITTWAEVTSDLPYIIGGVEVNVSSF